jgi:hypothetical protein
VEDFGISADLGWAAPWASAQQELAKISTYRTPRDKLVCILNCCKRINSSLAHASAGGHGADEFFPVRAPLRNRRASPRASPPHLCARQVLIYVTLHAAPVGLHASLEYIMRFRHPSKLVSESAYYLTHVQSALSFLADVTAEQLSIEAADFEKRLAESTAALQVRRMAEAQEAAAEAEAPAPAREADGAAEGSTSWAEGMAAAHGAADVAEAAEVTTEVTTASPAPRS